jgi:hypothetical protein
MVNKEFMTEQINKTGHYRYRILALLFIHLLMPSMTPLDDNFNYIIK